MRRARWSASWELSNPDRDRRCQLTFKLDPAPPGRALSLAPACAVAFPDLRPTAAWMLGRDDSLKILDAKGTVLLELTEVESGMYETSPSYTHYFLQTLAAISKERITDDLFGDWQFSRGGTAICQLTLGNTAYDTDSFALTLKPGCDPLDHALRAGRLALRPRPVRDARRQRTVLALRGERGERLEPHSGDAPAADDGAAVAAREPSTGGGRLQRDDKGETGADGRLWAVSVQRPTALKVH